MHIILGWLGMLTGVVLCRTNDSTSTNWWIVDKMLGGGV